MFLLFNNRQCSTHLQLAQLFRTYASSSHVLLRPLCAWRAKTMPSTSLAVCCKRTERAASFVRRGLFAFKTYGIKLQLNLINSKTKFGRCKGVPATLQMVVSFFFPDLHQVSNSDALLIGIGRFFVNSQLFLIEIIRETISSGFQLDERFGRPARIHSIVEFEMCHREFIINRCRTYKRVHGTKKKKKARGTRTHAMYDVANWSLLSASISSRIHCLALVDARVVFALIKIPKK